jgi:hypothetical protein
VQQELQHGSQQQSQASRRLHSRWNMPHLHGLQHSQQFDWQQFDWQQLVVQQVVGQQVVQHDWQQHGSQQHEQHR